MAPVQIESIKTLFALANQAAPSHPSYAIVRIEALSSLAMTFPTDFSFGFYAIGLMKDLQGEVRCGRQVYDFETGTMIFMSPNQLIGHELNMLDQANGWLLFFSRDFLARHPLSNQIPDYSFFDYAVSEALHLSEQEESSINQLFQNIHIEYQNPIDKHSKKVVLSNLDLILSYCERYYNRQFITRQEIESDFLIEFDKLLSHYFNTQNLKIKGVPNIAYFAEKLNMSSKYLSDKLKVLTGKSAQEHIHFFLLENAKLLLKQEKLTISEVAYQLGFEYPQYFSRLFKKKIGMTPKEFRGMN